MIAWRSSRGTQNADKDRKAFRGALDKARKRSWKDKVVTMKGLAPRTQPELHEHVKRFLNPKRKAACALEIGRDRGRGPNQGHLVQHV